MSPPTLPPQSPISTCTLSTPCTTTTSLSPSQTACPAIHIAISASPPLHQGGAMTACANAALLSTILSRVLAALRSEDRVFWCQLMDSLAMRTGMGDVSYSIAIAPAVLGVAEVLYGRQFGKIGGWKGGEFAWVEEEEGCGVGGFEGYVCDVLDEEGRGEFVRQRWYAGGLDCEGLLACFERLDGGQWDSGSEGGRMSGVSDSASWVGGVDMDVDMEMGVDGEEVGGVGG